MAGSNNSSSAANDRRKILEADETSGPMVSVDFILLDGETIRLVSEAGQ